MIKVTVEFNGESRLLTNEKKLNLMVKPGTTFREIIGILGNKYPALLGQVINVDGKSLYGTNMLSLNGKHMIENDAMENSPDDGDRIIMMSILAGG